MYAQPQIHLTDFKAETPGRRLPQRNPVESEVCQRTGKEASFLAINYRLLDSKDKLIAQSSTRKLRSDGSGVYPKDNQRTVAVDSRNA